MEADCLTAQYFSFKIPLAFIWQRQVSAAACRMLAASCGSV